jgi:hypothetical protein
VNAEKRRTRADFTLKTSVPKYNISLFKFSALGRNRAQSLKIFPHSQNELTITQNFIKFENIMYSIIIKTYSLILEKHMKLALSKRTSREV